MNTILCFIKDKTVSFSQDKYGESKSSKTMATATDSVSSKSMDSLSSKSLYSLDSLSSKSFSSSKSLSSFISSSLRHSNPSPKQSLIETSREPYFNEKGKSTMQKLFEPITHDSYSEYDFGISSNLVKIDEEAKTQSPEKTTFHIMRADSSLPTLLITTDQTGIVSVQQMQANIKENKKKILIRRTFRRDIELEYGNIYSNKEHVYNRSNDLYRKKEDVYIKRKYQKKNYFENDYSL